MSRWDPSKGGNREKTETEWLVLGLSWGLGLTLNLTITLTNHALNLTLSLNLTNLTLKLTSPLRVLPLLGSQASSHYHVVNLVHVAYIQSTLTFS